MMYEGGLGSSSPVNTSPTSTSLGAPAPCHGGLAVHRRGSRIFRDPATADDVVEAVVEAASLSAASLMEAPVLATLLSTIWRGLDATLYFLV